tara:strand:- start:2875 stop:3414 length:540 start_codon:yes stop_codon:yes gene_type:complete
LKKILRKKLIKKRQKNYLEISTEHISKIADLLKKKYKNIKVIGGYIPIKYEFDCLKLLKFLESKKYSICLPIIKKNSQMDFYKYLFKDPMKINKLGIPEPIKSTKSIIPDLILIPLVGYDKNLNRLGYGGGYYDRYIEKNSTIKKIVKIGLAFSFQKTKKLPINKFDKKLDRVITEKKI